MVSRQQLSTSIDTCWACVYPNCWLRTCYIVLCCFMPEACSPKPGCPSKTENTCSSTYRRLWRESRVVAIYLFTYRCSCSRRAVWQATAVSWWTTFERRVRGERRGGFVSFITRQIPYTKWAHAQKVALTDSRYGWALYQALCTVHFYGRVDYA